MRRTRTTVNKEGKGYGISWTRAHLAPILGVVILLLASCGTNETADRDPGAQDDIGQPTAEQQEGPTDSELEATLKELTRIPERYYEKQVTVNGRVGRIIAPNAFSLTSSDAAEGDDAFEVEAALVVGGEGAIPNLSEEQRVRVRGEVQRLNIKEIERKLNTNLDDSLYAEYEKKPVLLPGNVEVLAGGETSGQ